MAQDSKPETYTDVDSITINPSPQRVRNILTLQERVEAIKAYNHRPMYTKVARMFNCSWEQIKNIITNRDAIMEFYEATKYQNKPEVDSHEELQMDLRQRKIKFLGECVWECLQRIQFHSHLPITEELIRLKALEFQDLLRLDDFTPNKQWLNLFKATHNISLSNKQISLNRTPMPSMDLKDIMTYCTKLRATRTSNSLLLRYSSYDVNTMEYEGKRLRKLKFLEKVLAEYLLRAKFHHKSMRLNDQALRRVALEFNEILKVQDFDPTLTWIQDFTKSQAKQQTMTNIKRPPLSLDLKDILSYCSRMDNKAKATTITLTPKETSLQMRVMPKYSNSPEAGNKFQQKRKSIIYLDETEDKDVKPDIQEIREERRRLEQPPPLKIRKIESINNDPELQRKLQITSIPRATTISIKQIVQKEPAKEPFKAQIYIQKLIKAPTPTSKDFVKAPPESTNMRIKQEEEKSEGENFILPTNTITTATTQQQQQQSPLSHENNSNPYSYNSSDDGDAEMPRHVNSFRDVLLLLKPLEEYAMLKENYRAIGLITQLEDVLKNVPEENHTEEEFIG